MNLTWLYLLLIVQRVLELLLSRRHHRQLLAAGGEEIAPGSYPRMVGVHLLFYLGLLLEPHPWQVPWTAPNLALLAGFVLLQGLRYWTIGVLGRYWTTRIVVVPGSRVVRRGPFRWLRHPNYLVITLEFILLPLLLQTPITLLLVLPLNLLVLRERIHHEEQALRRLTDHAEQFPGRPGRRR